MTVKVYGRLQNVRFKTNTKLFLHIQVLTKILPQCGNCNRNQMCKRSLKGWCYDLKDSKVVPKLCKHHLLGSNEANLQNFTENPLLSFWFVLLLFTQPRSCKVLFCFLWFRFMSANGFCFFCTKSHQTFCVVDHRRLGSTQTRPH